MLDVKTVSYTRKINAEIAFSLEPPPTGLSHVTNTTENFTISMGDGSSFQGKLYIQAVRDFNSKKSCYFNCQFDQDVNNLSGELAMNGEKEHRILKLKYNTKNCLVSESLGDIPFKAIEGKITIAFEPSDEKMFEKNLTDYFGILTLKPGTTTQPNDIKLVVQEQEFEFNR